MSLDNIQKDVDQWTQQFNPPYWPHFRMLAKLTEETGEVSRALNPMYNFNEIPKKEYGSVLNNLQEELADVLFTVCCIANSHQINLEHEWEKMMQEKQYGRDNDRFEKKS